MIQGDSKRNQTESERIKAESKRRLQGEIRRTGPELDAQRMFSGPVRRESSTDILILITSNS